MSDETRTPEALTERMRKIRARLDAATPGPWAWESVQPERGVRYQHILAVGDSPACGKGIADTYHYEPIELPDGTVPPTFGNRANAEFIAQAPNDIAWLLETLATLRSGRTPDAAVPEPDAELWEQYQELASDYGAECIALGRGENAGGNRWKKRAARAKLDVFVEGLLARLRTSPPDGEPSEGVRELLVALSTLLYRLPEYLRRESHVGTAKVAEHAATDLGAAWLLAERAVTAVGRHGSRDERADAEPPTGTSPRVSEPEPEGDLRRLVQQFHGVSEPADTEDAIERDCVEVGRRESGIERAGAEPTTRVSEQAP